MNLSWHADSSVNSSPRPFALRVGPLHEGNYSPRPSGRFHLTVRASEIPPSAPLARLPNRSSKPFIKPSSPLSWAAIFHYFLLVAAILGFVSIRFVARIMPRDDLDPNLCPRHTLCVFPRHTKTDGAALHPLKLNLFELQQPLQPQRTITSATPSNPIYRNFQNTLSFCPYKF